MAQLELISGKWMKMLISEPLATYNQSLIGELYGMELNSLKARMARPLIHFKLMM